MSGRLDGKVAIVTGSGNGIGKGCALMFARQGAIVVGCDIDPAAGGATHAKAEAEGLTMDMIAPCDLTDEAAVGRLMGEVEARHGRADILVNAAASAVFKWIEELTLADWRRTLSRELDLVFLACRAAWPLLQRSGRASIVNFASANAYHALPGSPALAHCAGKGGVLAMTRQLAMEGAPHGIRVNTISPGLIVTAATSAHMDADPSFADTVLAGNMIKRLGQPEDIAHLATYLVSDEAGYVTGADFSCDGGATAW